MSKTINGTTSSPNLWTYKLVVTETSTDVTNRTSTVKVEHFLGRKSGAGSSYFSGSLTFKSTINGETKTTNKSMNSGTIASGGWKSLGSHTFTVSNAGNPTTINISGQQTSSAFNPSSSSASGTMDLTVLHLPPQITDVTILETDPRLTNLSLDNDVIVSNLSQKTFTITATPYDDATITTYNVYYDDRLVGTSSTNTVNCDFRNISIENGGIVFEVVDNMGGKGYFDNLYPVIPYQKPTLENTSIKRKTDSNTGLIDNIATLRLNGNYYVQDDAVGNANTITNVEYKIWNDTEPSYTDITSQATISDGAVTISGFDIAQIDFEKTYNYKIVITDYFGNTSIVTEGKVPTGIAVWTEFKDRVDFIKLTVNDENMFFYEDGDRYIANGLVLNGYVSNSTTYLYFNVTMPKSAKNINTITVNSFYAELRGVDGYLNSSAGYKEYTTESGYSIYIEKVDDYNIRIELRKSSAFTNTSNNTLVSARVNLELEFEE